MTNVSVVIPAYNEEKGIAEVLEKLKSVLIDRDFEVIVVNDASLDKTEEIAKDYQAKVINNPVNMGYGFSLKRGIEAAQNECVVITDADATYPIADIPKLVSEFDKGIDMVVGARQGRAYIPNLTKRIARFFFKIMSEFVVGNRIPDINSGFRVIRKSVIKPHLPELSNKFSFTTSSTLIFFLKHYFVKYVPINYEVRKGKSKVRYFQDSLRTMQIMVEIIARYNPIKLFLLLSFFPFLAALAFFVLGVMVHSLGTIVVALTFFFVGLAFLSLGFLASLFKKS